MLLYLDKQCQRAFPSCQPLYEATLIIMLGSDIIFLLRIPPFGCGSKQCIVFHLDNISNCNVVLCVSSLDIQRLKSQRMNYFDVHVYTCIRIFRSRRLSYNKYMMFYFLCGEYIFFILKRNTATEIQHRDLPLSFTQYYMLSGPPPPLPCL